MNIPITIGWPQLFLFLLAVIGLGLLISSVMGLRSRGIDEDDRDEETHTGRTTRQLYRPRRRHRLRRGLSGVVLLVIAISLLWLTALVQTYLGMATDTKVARVHATRVANQPHTMSVELILYDNNGRQTSDDTYLVQGDEWILQGNILKFPNWTTIIGLHSGYKLTRLEGRFDDPNMERTAQHTVVVLNGGDDNFFKTAQSQTWLSPIVEATYGNAVYQGTGQNGSTFDVLVSQTGLYAEPVR